MLIGFFISLPKEITSYIPFFHTKKAVWIFLYKKEIQTAPILSEIRKTISFL